MLIYDVIALTESQNNQYAIRFEEKVYLNIYRRKSTELLQIIQKYNECSFDTAKMIFSCSWGKYQIMGFNLYSVCQLKTSIGEFLCSDNLQNLAFMRFCTANKIDLSKVELELKALSEQKAIIKLKTSSHAEFTGSFKSFLENNQKSYSSIITFISRFNGSKFLSDSFYSYLLRMLYNYDKLKDVGGEQK